MVEARDTIALGRGAAVLGHGEATTIACRGFSRDLPIERADVTISIEFSARFWPKPLVVQQQFVGARSRSGVFHWWPSARKARERGAGYLHWMNRPTPLAMTPGLAPAVVSLNETTDTS
jgi:hypothetical protein